MTSTTSNKSASTSPCDDPHGLCDGLLWLADAITTAPNPDLSPALTPMVETSEVGASEYVATVIAAATAAAAASSSQCSTGDIAASLYMAGIVDNSTPMGVQPTDIADLAPSGVSEEMSALLREIYVDRTALEWPAAPLVGTVPLPALDDNDDDEGYASNFDDDGGGGDMEEDPMF